MLYVVSAAAKLFCSYLSMAFYKPLLCQIPARCLSRLINDTVRKKSGDLFSARLLARFRHRRKGLVENIRQSAYHLNISGLWGQSCKLVALGVHINA